MEPVDSLMGELRSEYREARAQTVRSDYIATENPLEQYRKDYEEIYIKQRNAIERNMYNTVSAERVDREHQHPVLFIRGKPVLNLFLYNLRQKFNREQLIEFLKGYDVNEITCSQVHYHNGQTTAKIKCHNLFTSCLLQALACANKLSIRANNIIKYVRVRPDNPKIVTTSSRVPCRNIDLKVIPEALRVILDSPDILKYVTNGLNAEEFYNFYKACQFHPSFHAIPFIFKVSSIRYQATNGLALIMQDARLFKFSSIIFNTCSVILDVSIVQDILQTQARERNEASCRIRELDLTGVNLTPQCIERAMAMYKPDVLRIAKTTSPFDRELSVALAVKKMYFARNAHTRLRFLTHEFNALTVLKVTECKLLLLEPIIAFAKSNVVLKVLEMHDCFNIDIAITMPESVDTVFSGTNVIEKFTLSYIERTDLIRFNEYFDVNYNPQYTHSEISELDITNNGIFDKVLARILIALPNLKSLYAIGVYFTERLDFALNPILERIKLDCSLVINNALESLHLTNVKSLFIVNVLGKKRRRRVNLYSVANLIKRSEKFDLTLVNSEID